MFQVTMNQIKGLPDLDMGLSMQRQPQQWLSRCFQQLKVLPMHVGCLTIK
jgi:hypothetical protein